MKTTIILSILLIFMSLTSFAKKDINAWKNEKNLEQQYKVFKENLNYWNKNYFLDERQLDQFYTALSDSVKALENVISGKAKTINSLQNELNSTNKMLSDTKTELDYNIKNRNAIEVFGIKTDKGIYTFFVSMLIIALLVLLGIVFMLYKRSNNVTARVKKDYNDLKNEFEIHKKDSLERYTKINMELHHTRMELNKR